MKVLGYYCIGHDANMCAYDSDTQRYAVLELERLFRRRHFHMDTRDRKLFSEITLQCLAALNTQFGIQNEFDILCLPVRQYGAATYPVDGVINYKQIRYIHHQAAHAAAAHFQSPFNRSLVLCYHGGGDDGSFNAFVAGPEGVNQVFRSTVNLGIYSRVGRAIHRLRDTSQPLSVPGKAMGLAAYGTPQMRWYEFIKRLYLENLPGTADSIAREFPEATTPDGSADLAATNQQVFQDLLVDIVEPLLSQYSNLPVCLSGGCALNIIANEVLRTRFNIEIFVPPNPNDGGLAAGYTLIACPPKGRVELAYCGLPIVDRDSLLGYVKMLGAVRATPLDLARLLKSGKIVGICVGNSECGPRALGNRSILCDPSFPGIKESLNAKVKFRESFRPFAAVVREDEATRYFELSGGSADMSYMAFNPKVRREWIQQIPAVVHVDLTARIQTVSSRQHQLLFELLGVFEQIRGHGILLNTSFNTHGRPIVSSIDESLSILSDTQLDYVYIEGFLFSKQ